MDYMINPVLMGGLVKETSADQIKVHLHGRLGVITVPKRIVADQMQLEPGHELCFYFSYLQVRAEPYDYDSAAMDPQVPISPCFLGGVLSEVNDTAVKAMIQDGLGTVAVPRRWVFTNEALREGQSVEFYFSCMKVTGKRDIPAESI